MLSTTLKSLSFAAASCCGLAACGDMNEQKNPLFDGVPFSVSVKPVAKKQSLAPFEVIVREPTRSAKGALEAASHVARRYCIENFGSSRFEWTNIVIDDEGAYELSLVKNNGLFLGSCTA